MGNARLGVLWMLAMGCGGGGGDVTPDAAQTGDAAPGVPLTIKLYKHFPFVEGDTANATFVAAQDGDGAWTPLTGNSGVYTMPRSADHYGVMVVCSTPQSSFAKLFLKTAADGFVQTTNTCFIAPPASKTVTVTVHNVPAGSTASVSGPHLELDTTTTTDVDLHLDLEPGPSEIFGFLSDGQGRTTRVVRLPAFTLDAARSFAIDFATDGAAPEQHPLTVAPVAAMTVLAGFETAIGSYTLENTVNATYAALPAALRRAGDKTTVAVIADDVSARASLVTPGPLAITFAPAIMGPAFTGTAARPTWAISGQPTRTGAGRLVMNASTPSQVAQTARRWQVFLALARVPAGAVAYTLPDFSGLAGLPAGTDLTGGARLSWFLQLDDQSTGADGATVQLSSVAGGAIEP